MSELPTIVAYEILEQERISLLSAASFIGSVGLEASCTVEPLVEHKVSETLLSLAQRARLGDGEAELAVAANSRIATVEAILKSGNITKVSSVLTDSGQAYQYGQSHRDVQRNSLLYRYDSPEMAARVRAEVINNFRIEEAAKSGLLDDYVLLVTSLYPDDMKDEDAERAGFFTDTKTGVFQLTTVENGMLVTESAFVAGQISKKSERYDISAVINLYNALALKINPATTTDILNTPILIRKDILQNGVSDVVRWYDNFVGQNTFYGLAPSVNEGITYEAFAEHCLRRQSGFESTVSAIKDELIAGAAWLVDPLSAVNALAELVKKHTVKRALDDYDIDLAAFGAEAAHQIELYRLYMSLDDTASAQKAAELAHKKAKVTMCGVRGGATSPEVGPDDGANSETNAENSEDDVQPTGKIRCIKCRENVNAKDVIKPKSWCCPKCKYEVDVCTGKVLREGTHGKNKPVQEPAQVR